MLRCGGESRNLPMRVLLVEDEETTVDQIRGRLEAECGAVVEVAVSRNGAQRILESDRDFDLIICDLRIPTQDGSLDIDEEHGLFIHDVAMEKHPGTFRRFFSGYVTFDNVGDRLSRGPSLDVFGSGKTWPLVGAFRKSNQPEFLEWAKELSTSLTVVDEIAVQTSDSSSLSEYEGRAPRIFARGLDGAWITATSLGGMSGTKVLRVEIRDGSGAKVGLVVAKIGPIEEVEDEHERYRRFAPPVLNVGTFAPYAGKVVHGCGRSGAVFFTLAEKGYKDFFQLVTDDVSRSEIAVTRLRESHQDWRGNTEERELAVGRLRLGGIGDGTFNPWRQQLGRGEVERAEDMVISVRQFVQHGDLHGLNVLVDASGQPLIIDYGDLGHHPGALDPVTLEMSFLFHSEHPELGGWPTVEQASRWFDLEDYTAHCPVRAAIHACRQWALSDASRGQVAAVAYAHAVRQMKYPDTNKALAVAIAKAALRELSDG